MSDQIRFDLPPKEQPRPRGRWWPAVVVLLIGGAAGFCLRPLAVGGSGAASTASIHPEAGLLDHKDLVTLAETLEKNQLYAEAAGAWEQAAGLAPPAGTGKAEMLFRIGKNLSLANQHERAMSYLFAAEAADTDGKWKTSINKLVLEGLSALGHEDARAHQAARRVSLTAEGDTGPKRLAAIGGEPITEVDLDAFARRMVAEQMSMQRRFMSPEAFDKAIDSTLERFKTTEGCRQLLQMYIRQELLYREALAAGLPDADGVRRQIVDARRQILTDAFLDTYLVKNLHIGQTDIENAYEARKAEYIEPEAVKVETIVVDREEAQKQVDDALKSGTDFAEARKQFSTLKPTADSPDPFDRWITREDRVPLAADEKAVLAHVFALDDGQVGAKWLEGTAGKWLRFRLAERRPQRQLPLTECRDRVESDVRASKQKDLLNQLQQSLQRKYEVVIDEPPPGSQPHSEDS